MKALGRRSKVVLAVALALVAFAAAFAIARVVADDSGDASARPVEPLPAQAVTINNLERAPTVKPLRSIAGESAP